MGSKWNGSRDLGGILRKSNQRTSENTEPRGGDLLVFGYACKVFRDDEKALHIDQGKHLIPWMGDKTLKIDRYDVRAALSDLSHYEPPPGGYTNRLDCLTPAEQRAEQLCEEERYYSLYHNEEEEQMYQEEELKRLHQEGSTSYGQVQFDYNSQTSNEHKTDDDKLEEIDEIFTPLHNFSIPPNIELPETMKQHAIIEKTAKFISGQGPQMEILIKAKQSNNPQFEFLNQNNRLNHYYKFVLLSFKNGTYPAEVQKTEGEMSSAQSQIAATASKSSAISMESMQSTFAYPKLPVPILKYKPSANCSYTQLISKIKGVPLPKEQPEVETKTHDKNENITFLDYSSYYGNQSIDMTTTPLATTNNTEIPTQPAVSQKTNTNTDGVEIKNISTGLMLAQCYASDTEDENDSFENIEPPPAPNIPTPPDSLQNIIDKTAIYVAKNGKQFENILRTKQDERFSFLDTTDEFYPYYLHKVTGLNSSYSISNGDDKPKSMTPVSFSIKPKEESSVPINPALLQETSDDDDSENKMCSTMPTTISQNPTSVISVPDQQSQQQQHVQIKIPIEENQLAIKGTSFVTNIPISSALAAIAARTTTTSISYNAGQTVQRSRFDVDNTGAIVNRLNNSIAPPPPIIRLEAQQKELKRAEEKVKDRLAQIAREKLGLISKEKQLQLERKKKAMAFLNQIKSSGTKRSSSIITTTTSPTIENSIKLKSECSTDSDSSSVHSIPLSATIIDDDELSDTAGTIDRCKSIEKIKDSEIQEDNKNGDEIKRRSRSKSSSHHRKKKKSKHSKKKSKKRSRSRSQSSSREHKRSKRSSSRKSKKRHRES